MKVYVTVSRSAYHTVTLLLDAESVEVGQEKVEALLDRPQRTEMADFDTLGATVVSDTCTADDESSFEVLDSERAPL